MKSRKFDNGGFESYDSVQEFISTLSKRPNNKAFTNTFASQSKDEAFTGTPTFEDAQQIMKQGYKDGAKDLLKCAEGLRVQNTGKVTKQFADVKGFAPIVGAAVVGKPKCMINKRTEIKQARVINIILDNGVSADVSKDVLTIGGKNIYSLVKDFESKGVRVNLHIMDCTYIRQSHKFALLMIKIKDSKQAINPQLIAYPIMHPSFFRRHCFKWIETSPYTDYKSITSGYGAVGRYYMAQEAGSALRFMMNKGICNKDSYYIDVQKAAQAQSITELKDILGVQ